MASQTPPPGSGGQPPPSYPGGPPPGSPGGGGTPGGAGGYGAPPPGYGPGYGGYPGPQNSPPSQAPTVLSVIGIVCWFLCSPAAIVLGIIAQGKFRNQGRSDTLAKTAWIGGVVALVLGIIVYIGTHGKA